MSAKGTGSGSPFTSQATAVKQQSIFDVVFKKCVDFALYFSSVIEFAVVVICSKVQSSKNGL